MAWVRKTVPEPTLVIEPVPWMVPLYWALLLSPKVRVKPCRLISAVDEPGVTEPSLAIEPIDSLLPSSRVPPLSTVTVPVDDRAWPGVTVSSSSRVPAVIVVPPV